VNEHAPQAGLLSSLLHAVATPLAVWSLDGTLLTCSASLLSLLNTTEAELKRRGRDRVIHADDRHLVTERIATWEQGRRTTESLRIRIMTATGSVIRTQSCLAPLFQDQQLIGLLIEVEEVGDGLSVRDALDEQARMFQDVFDQLGDAVYSMDGRRRMVWANSATERLFGRTFAELQRTHISEILMTEDLGAMNSLREAFDSGERVPRRIEFRIRRGDGAIRWVSGSLLMQRDATGAFARSWVVARDVTRERESAERLAQDATEARQIAFTDPLTGLANRRAFDDALINCIEAVRSGKKPIIVVIDLDQLKNINDTSGHQVGDEAIRTVARAITDRIRGEDAAFRIGGDEFAVIVQGGNPDAITKRMGAAIPFQPLAEELLVSVGTATCGIDADDPQEVFRIADARMFEMKRARRT